MFFIRKQISEINLCGWKIQIYFLLIQYILLIDFM